MSPLGTVRQSGTSFILTRNINSNVTASMIICFRPDMPPYQIRMGKKNELKFFFAYMLDNKISQSEDFQALHLSMGVISPHPV